MNTVDKELLLKDLCARLPYGVICHYDTIVPMVGKVKSYGRLYNISFFDTKPCFQFHCNRDVFDFDNVKPYLFPLSSMTEEQRKEYNYWKHEVPVCHYEYGDVVEEIELYDSPESFEYLIENHFDYRGLIPKGLAIDATGLDIY